MFVLFLVISTVHAQVPWIEDFTGLSDGAINDGPPTAWSIDVSLVPINGSFEVTANVFTANHIEDAGQNDEAIWISESIDISSVSAIELSLDVWDNNNVEGGDWLRGTFQIDGESEVEFFMYDGDISGTSTEQVINLQGGSIIVRIYARNGAANETYYFDNISITEFIPTPYYSITDGSWNNTATWSSTWPTITPVTTIPDENSAVFIQNGNQVNIPSSAHTMNLNVEDGDVLFTGNTDLTIHKSGTVTINNGSSINRNGNSANLIFDNGADFNLIVNDNSPGISLEEIFVRDISSLTISGTGAIQVRDDFDIQGDNVEVTNEIDTLFIGWDGTDIDANLDFSGADCHLINNGTIVNNNTWWGIVYKGSNNTITNNGCFNFHILDFLITTGVFNNYGTVNQYSSIQGIANSGDAQIYNFSGATWNWSGNSCDNDLQLYCNYEANTFNYNRSGYVADNNDQFIINPTDSYWNLSLTGTNVKRATNNLDINGNLIITSEFEPGGYDINLAGNWNNSGSFYLPTQTVTFDGDADQSITNSSGETFYNLQINKTSATLTLLNDIEASNSLIMTQGNVDANGNILSISAGTASSLSYTSGQIIGKLERQIGELDTFLFPIGTSSSYNPFQLTSTGGSAGSIIGQFTASDPGGTGLSVTDTSDALDVDVFHQFVEGYWTLEGNNSVNRNYNLELSENGFTTFTVDGNTRIIDRTSGGNWNNPISGFHGSYSSPFVERTGLNINDGNEFDFCFGHPSCVPVSITTNPVDKNNICEGSDTLFSVEATGGGTLSYQWYKVESSDILLTDVGNISGATTDTLRISNIDDTDAGQYYCVVNNICASPATSANATLGLDDEDPTITCPSNVDQSNDLALCTAIVNGLSPITGDNCGVVLQTWSLTGATIGNSAATGINDASGLTFNLDTTTVSYYIEDAQGNNTTCNFEVRIIDTIKPIITTCAADTTINLDASCDLTLPDFTSDVDLTVNECSGYIVTQAPVAGTIISDTTEVTLYVTDEFNNVDSCTFLVNTIDTIRPVITSCAADTTINLDASCNLTLPDFTSDADLAVNECSGYVVTQAPVAGTIISDTTEVTLYVTDEFNNIDSCTFLVNTIDTIRPVAASIPTLSLEISLNTGFVVITPSDLDNGSTDNCGIVGDSVDIDTFYCDDIGNTIPVTLTVWDEFGNSSTSLTDVTITGYDIEPEITVNMLNDTALCSGEDLIFNLSSNADSTSYMWEFSVPDASITGWLNDTVDYPLDGDFNLIQTLYNSSDTAKKVSINIKSRLFKLCDQPQFDTTITFWIIPGLSVNLEPDIDTICNGEQTNIIINSVNVFENLRFKYRIEPVNPSEVHIGYFDATDTIDQVKGYVIKDTLTNLSEDAQLVYFIASPYVLNNKSAGTYCDGVIDTTEMWVEPTAKVHFDHYADTVCTGLTFTPIELSSVSKPTIGVRFDYTIVPQNIGQVTIVNNGPTTMLSEGALISDSLYNLSGTVQEVYVIVTPYLLDGINNPRCSGVIDTIIIQLTPSLVMQDTARKYVKYNIDCFGNSNGAFYMYPYGGILAFGSSVFDHQNLSYEITGPGVSLPLNDSLATDVYVVDDLVAGIYTLKATDFSGCISEKIDTITQPETPLNVEIFEIVPLICQNSKGIVSARKTGGTYFTIGPDTIGYKQAYWAKSGFLSGPKLSDTIYEAGSGDYIVALVDTNGCMAHDTAYLSGSEVPSFRVISTPRQSGDYYNISCKGAEDGIINALPSVPGTYLYNLLMIVDSDTSINFTNTTGEITWENLPAGEYQISITNYQGCKNSVPVTLTEPDSLVIRGYSTSEFHDSSWNVSCNYSSDGFINIDSISIDQYRIPNYTWTRNGIFYDNIKNLADIPAGDYKLVLDDKFCYDSVEINIIPPPAIEYSSIDSIDNLCYGDSTGQINVTATGGVLNGGDYHYRWSHDTTINNNVAYNLTSGLYSITTTDSLGCNLIEYINIEQPDSILIHSTLSNNNGYAISCFEGNNGDISINITGGTGTPTFSWEFNGQAIPGTNQLTNLQAGEYLVVVEDQNNCVAIDSFNLTQPDELEISFNIKDKVCKVYGEVIADVSGGVKFANNDYQYEWLTISSTTSVISNLIPDIYPLRVTDRNNCTILDTALVGESSSMSISLAEERPISCYHFNDGVLAVSVDNATPPLNILWNGQAGTERLEEVAEGTYIVEITDQNECRDFDTIMVNHPDQLLADFIVDATSCYDTADGSISLDAIGGNGNYQFMFNGSLINDSEINNLHSGDYLITIQDANNCRTDTIINIRQPDSLIINEVVAERIPPTCPDAPDGKLVVEGLGGTEPYNFVWIGEEVNGETIDNIKQGNYRIRLIDNNGCINNKRIYLTAELPACLDIPNAFSPNNDQYNDIWDIQNPLDENMDLSLIYPEMIIKVFNRWGQVVWISDRGYPKSGAWKGTDSHGRDLPVDSYHYIIYLNNDSGRTMTGIVTIVK